MRPENETETYVQPRLLPRLRMQMLPGVIEWEDGHGGQRTISRATILRDEATAGGGDKFTKSHKWLHATTCQSVNGRSMIIEHRQHPGLFS